MWEHPNGARLHCGGLLRLPDGSTVNEHDHKYFDERMLAEIMQPPPHRIRALMVWAELIMSLPNDAVSHGDRERQPDNTKNDQ